MFKQADTSGDGQEKTVPFSPLLQWKNGPFPPLFFTMMLKVMILPRQARDKHWESTHEKTVDAGTLSRSELIRSLRRCEKRAFKAIYI